jgi:multidrug efflux system membrane fusion protein
MPLARVDLAFKRGGYVAEVRRVGNRPGGLLDEGDHVKRGMVLARLRDADYRVKLEQARAQLIQANAAENQSKQDLDRANKMFAGSAMPKSTLDGAENKAAGVSAQRRAAELQVQEAELALADCALTAPLDAVVLKRMVEPGNLVGPGSPGFILANNSSMKVTFGVPDVMLDKVKVETRLDVSVEAVGDGSFSGQVNRVAAAADPKTRLFEIEVLLPNSDGRLRAGMIASLRVDAVGPAANLSVPLASVVRPPGKTEGFAVFVAEGDVLRLQTIEPGELCGGTIEVRSGVKSSDRVVVDGAAQAFSGERVAFVP